MRIQLLYFMSLLFMMTICYDLTGAKTNFQYFLRGFYAAEQRQ